MNRYYRVAVELRLSTQLVEHTVVQRQKSQLAKLNKKTLISQTSLLNH